MILLTENTGAARRTVAVAAEHVVSVDVYDTSISDGGGSVLKLADGQRRIVYENQSDVLALVNLALSSVTYPLPPEPPPES